jgi:hypothetical protein
MPFTTAVDQAILDWFLTEYTTPYAGYSTADPTKDGSGLAEPDGGTAYARVDVTAGLSRTDSEIDNDAEIAFPEATSSQGTAAYACLFDAEEGDLIWYGALTTPKAIATGDTPRFPAGDFNITQS